MDFFTRLIDRVSIAAGQLTAWLLVPLIAASVYEVAARYLFKAPTIWAYEIGYMVMGSHALLGIAYTLQAGGHVRIDALSSRFSASTRATIDLLGYLVLLPIVIWLTFGLWGYWREAFISGEGSGQSAWNPRIWPFRLVFFAAFTLFVLQVVAEILRSIQVIRRRRPTGPAHGSEAI